MTEKKRNKWVIWRFSCRLRDNFKVVIRRRIQVASFGRLWGVRFWHQFDNPISRPFDDSIFWVVIIH